MTVAFRRDVQTAAGGGITRSEKIVRPGPNPLEDIDGDSPPRHDLQPLRRRGRPPLARRLLRAAYRYDQAQPEGPVSRRPLRRGRLRPPGAAVPVRRRPEHVRLVHAESPEAAEWQARNAPDHRARALRRDGPGEAAPDRRPARPAARRPRQPAGSGRTASRALSSCGPAPTAAPPAPTPTSGRARAHRTRAAGSASPGALRLRPTGRWRRARCRAATPAMCSRRDSPPACASLSPAPCRARR